MQRLLSFFMVFGLLAAGGTALQSYHRPQGINEAPDGTNKMIALTFDDGPCSTITTHILDTLEEVSGRATFFVLGERTQQHSDMLQRMVAQGHEIGSHSWSHERLTRLSADTLRRDLDKTAQAIEQYSGVAPRLMRPPYGAVNDRMKQHVDMPMIHWSIDSEDWRYCEQLCRNRSAEKRQRDFCDVVNSVVDYVQDGDIVLMHDLYAFTQDVADAIILELHHQGWQLVTVSELFAAQGIEPQPGRVYYNAR